MNEWFSRFAALAAHWTGHWAAFTLSVLLVVIWGVSGPLFGWSDTWQLYANTATTIITFLMVFVLQHTQNRDSLALHLKLDGIIKAIEGVDDRLMAAEEESEEALHQEIASLRGDG
jgi:low affinity Fe/Cu permease